MSKVCYPITMKRITLVACFNDESNKKIEHIVARDKEKLCKVPYNIVNRFANDTLPYHITLSAWDEDKTEYIISKLGELVGEKIKGTFSFKVMDSTIKGNILYLDLVNDTAVKMLQTRAYNLLPTQKYNPLTYKLHATINIAENKDHNLNLLSRLKNKNLQLTIDKVCLFEIYPAKLLSTVELS